jgi:FkbM family methyltransferase
MLIDGERMNLILPDKILIRALARWLSEPWNLQLYNSLSSYRPIRTCIDVGANVGLTAIVMTLAFPDATVHAFEPSKYNYRYLLENTQNFPNIVPYNLGVWSDQRITTISMPTDEQRPTQRHWKTNCGLLSVYGKGGLSEEIHTIALDDYFSDRVDVIKVDVEGAEIDVLKGAERILAEDRPLIAMEVRGLNLKMAGRTVEEAEAFIDERGYVCTGHIDGDAILVPKERVTIENSDSSE